MKVLGIVLILLGLLGLAYQGITYTTREKVVDVGPIEVSKESAKTIPLPPLAAALAVISGIAIVAVGSKR